MRRSAGPHEVANCSSSARATASASWPTTATRADVPRSAATGRSGSVVVWSSVRHATDPRPTETRHASAWSGRRSHSAVPSSALMRAVAVFGVAARWARTKASRSAASAAWCAAEAAACSAAACARRRRSATCWAPQLPRATTAPMAPNNTNMGWRISTAITPAPSRPSSAGSKPPGGSRRSVGAAGGVSSAGVQQGTARGCRSTVPSGRTFECADGAATRVHHRVLAPTSNAESGGTSAVPCSAVPSLRRAGTRPVSWVAVSRPSACTSSCRWCGSNAGSSQRTRARGALPTRCRPMPMVVVPPVSGPVRQVQCQ